MDILCSELVPYLGRVGRTWAILTLSRLIQTCKALATSGWEKHVTRLGGEKTGYWLRDSVLMRFASTLEQLSYHAPCHHSGDDHLTDASLRACTKMRTLKLHGNQCYSTVGLKELPPNLIRLSLNSVAGDDYVIRKSAIGLTPSIRELTVMIFPDDDVEYRLLDYKKQLSDPTLKVCVDVHKGKWLDKDVASDDDTRDDEEEEEEEKKDLE